MIAAAITQGDVTIENCIPKHVEPIALKLQEAQVGVEISENKIRVKGKGPISSVNAKTHPYPGFPTDIQAQFMALMTFFKKVSGNYRVCQKNRSPIGIISQYVFCSC